jgi:hypothetical protein
MSSDQYPRAGWADPKASIWCPSRHATITAYIVSWGRPLTHRTCEVRAYVPLRELRRELEVVFQEDVQADYVTLSGSGEPTLHSGIGEVIQMIKGLTTIPVAVLTNGSLLWMSDVQDALMAADLVLPSLDAGNEHLFRYVNRPHGDISFEQMADGLAAFTKRFSGEVWLEVLLLAGVTGMPSEAKKIAVQEVGDCPAGRLVLHDKSGLAVEPEFEPSIGVVFDPTINGIGPLWVRGGIPIEAADGYVYEIRNRVTLCRCGKSLNKPFCDGKHVDIE